MGERNNIQIFPSAISWDISHRIYGYLPTVSLPIYILKSHGKEQIQPTIIEHTYTVYSLFKYPIS